MNILFLNTNIGYGGASKMMAWLANQYAISGHNVTFMTFRSSEVNQQLLSDVKHVHVDLEPSSGKGVGFLGTVRYLHSYVKAKNVDLAVGFLSPSQLRLSFACLGTSTKILFSHRGDPTQIPSSLKQKLSSFLNKWAFSRADYFVFQTPQARNCFKKSIKDRSVVIANPIVPLKRTMSRENNINKHVISIARLDIKQKRQDLLINAFKQVVYKHPDYTLDLYGDGEDENQLKMLAKDYKSIRFMGKTSDIVGVSQNAAISVLSSDFEGIPNSLLESMSLGLPCIATDCSPGGASMLIRSGENGLLVPRDNVDALADAMNYMIENKDKAEDMGINAMEVNTIYSENNIKKKWLDVLERL